MKLKMIQTAVPIFTPDGGGSTSHFLRDNVFDLFLEGHFVRVSMKGKKDAQVYDVPLANVAVIYRDASAPPPEAVKK